MQQFLLLATIVGAVFACSTLVSEAQFNQQINYQGKLTNASNVAVADAGYQMEFSLYTTDVGGTAIWTETRTGVNEVIVENGLFSVMLGSVNPLTGVDFNQTLYLGVTVEADSEMTPRKVLGAVPAAFSANRLGGVASSSFVRSDAADEIAATTATTLLTINQSGAGNILDLLDGGTNVFTVRDGGNVGIGTSSPSARLTVVGNTVVTGTTTLATTTVSSLSIASLSGLLFGTAGNVSAIATSTLGIALSDTTGTLSATRGGTGLSTITQNQLLIGGAGNTWNQIATSSLGLSAAFSTIAQFDTLVTDVTGVTGLGSFVLSASPTFTGTATFTNLIGTNATITSATTTNFTISSLISGRVPFITTGGRLIDSANLAFDGTRLSALNLGVTGTSTFTGAMSVGTSTQPYLLSVAGTFGVVSSSLSSVFMVDPTTGRVAIGTSTASTTETLTIAGGSIDVTPSGLRIVGQLDTLGDSQAGLVVEDGIVYGVSNNPATDLHIVDASNPQSPRILSETGAPSSGDIVKVGNYLYLFGGITSSAEVEDVTNPSAPVTVGTFDVGQTTREAVVDGNYIFVGTNSATTSVIVYNIANRTSPQQIATINAGAAVTDLAVHQNKLYLALASTTAAVRIYNIQNPSATTLLGTAAASSSPTAITVANDRVYLGANVSGNRELYVYQTTNPTSIQLLTAIDITTSVSDMMAVDETLFVTGNSVRAFIAYDISSSTQIIEQGRVSLGASTIYDFDIEGQYAYVGGQVSTQGLAIIKLPGVTAPSLQSGALYAEQLRATQANISGQLSVVGRAAFGLDASVARRLDVGTSLTIGTTSTSSRALTVAGDGVFVGNLSVSDTTTISRLALVGAFLDSANASGTLGQILQSTGTSTRWVATSTLGFSGIFTTIAELDTLITDVTGVTGTGSFVLSASPTFTGTSIFANSSTTNATTTNFAISGLTSGRVPFITTSGRLIDSANLAFDGTQLSVLNLNVTGTSTLVGTSSFLANVSIGTTSSLSRLMVQGVAGSNDVFTVASSTGNPLFRVLASGNTEITGQFIDRGVIWATSSAAGNDDGWQAITYGNGLFVAVASTTVAGGNDAVMYSSDGINWATSSAAGNDDRWASITYGNGLFVAVGRVGDRVMTSPDGINWTARSAAGNDDTWTSITYGNGLFVAVGSAGDRVMTSPDGINWTARSAAGNDDPWTAVTYGNGRFVAVHDNIGTGSIMTSPDGINWTQSSGVGNDDFFNAVTYGNGLFVVVGTFGNRVITSPDGINWTARTAAGENDGWNEVTYGNGVFLAVGNSGDRVMTSPDGINWTARSATGDNDSWLGIVYGNGRFVAVGNSGDRVMYSGTQNQSILATNNIYQGIQSFTTALNIGTTSNNALLTIQGTASSSATLLSIASSTGMNLLTLNAAGDLGIGSTSPSAKLTVAGNTFLGGSLTATGTLAILGTSTLATTSITRLALSGAFLDSTNASGTTGMVMQSTGTSTRWVATSTLGISGGASTFLSLTDTPSSYTANRVMFTNTGATALTDSANFTFDGSRLSTLNLNVAGTSTFTGTSTFAGNVAIGTSTATSTRLTVVATSTNGSLLAQAIGVTNTSRTNAHFSFTAASGNSINTVTDITNVFNQVNLNNLTAAAGADLTATAETINITDTGTIDASSVRTLVGSTISVAASTTGTGNAIGQGIFMLGGDEVVGVDSNTIAIGAIGDAYGFRTSGFGANNYYGYFASDDGGANTNAFGFYAQGNIRSYFGGNVGIGTTTSSSTAASKLTVSGTSTFAGNILPATTLTYDIGSSSARFRNIWAETLNIGTSTWSIFNGANGRLAFSNGPLQTGTEALSILDNGNMGVGTSSPSARLTVAAPLASTTGSELVTNGTFTGNATGWSLSGLCTSYSNNSVQINDLAFGGTTCGNNSNGLSTTVSLTAGTDYLLSYEVAAATSTNLSVLVLDPAIPGEGKYVANLSAATGVHYSYFKAITTATYTITFFRSSPTSTSQAVVDNVSLRAVTPTTEPLRLAGFDGSNYFRVDTVSNIAVGLQSLASTSGGHGNIALGSFALNNSGLGSESNIAIGSNALRYNTIGQFNIAIGQAALAVSATTSGNIAIGFRTLESSRTGERNTAIGTIALTQNVSGSDNTALGYQALSQSNYSQDNTAIGSYSLYRNRSGTLSTAVGSNAAAWSTGSYNTSLGAYAMGGNAGGENNVAIGYYSMAGSIFNVTSGRRTVAIGNFAGQDIGSSSDNIFIGHNTGRGIDTGSFNTIIGANVTGLSGTLSNNIIIADGAGNQRINVGSTGNVGIGTTSPFSRLSVVGNTFIGGNLTATGTLSISGTSTFAGRVGIGTTSPVSLLSVVGDSFLNGGVGIGTAPSTTVGSLALMTSAYTNQQVVISNGLTSAVPTIPNTYSPTFVVRASETTGSRPLFFGYQNGSSWGSYVNMGACGSFSQLCFNFGNGANDYVALANNGTSLAIGGVTGATGFAAGDGDFTNVFFGNTGNVLFGNTGNVGIGTSTPGSKLTVAGNTFLGGNLTATATSTLLGNVSVGTTSSLARLFVTASLASTTGSELVTNGTFTGNATGWGLGAPCTVYGSNQITLTGSSTCFAEATTSVSLTAGQSYALTFTVVSATNDALAMFIIDTSVAGGSVYATGTHTVYFTSYTTGAAVLDFSMKGALAGSSLVLDTVSLRSVDSLRPALAMTGYDGLNFFSVANPSILAIGAGALQNGATSSNNLAIGAGALRSAGGGSVSNVAIGINALSNNTVGSQNVALGTNALFMNTTGGSNIAVGEDALLSNSRGSGNLALGWSALQYNTLGDDNIALGNYTLSSNATGSENIAIGEGSLGDNIDGSQNIAIGDRAMDLNTSGIENVAIGDTALGENLTGSFNVAIGDGALDNASTSETVAIGYRAGNNFPGYSNFGGTYIGYRAGNELVDGSDYNTFFGYQAGYSVTSGAYNTIIGQYVDGLSGITSGSNNILIGNDVQAGLVPTASRQLNIGNLIFGTNVSSSTAFSTGFVGIGTSSPLALLDVYGTGVATTTLRVSAPSGRAAAFELFRPGAGSTDWRMENDAGQLNFSRSTNDLSTQSTILSLANFQIGVAEITPNAVFEISMDGSSADEAFMISFDDNGDGDVFIVDSNRRVGIGTTTTTDLLTVNGTINIANPLSGLEIGNVRALYASSTDRTTFIGLDAGRLVSSSSIDSIAIGFQSMYTATSASYDNVAIGTFSQYSNTSGYRNVSLGSETMFSNTTGYQNVALGHGALYFNTTGNRNVAIGAYAMQSNSTGTQNVAIGNFALNANTTGSQNFALGEGALANNSTGTSNIAIGYLTLDANTTGFDNTGIGDNALGANIIGYYNTAIGSAALQSATSSSFNTSVGWYSLNAQTTGFENTALGVNAFRNLTTGYDSVAIGVNAGLNTRNGFENTIIGSDAFFSNVSGASSTIIGFRSGFDLVSATSTGANTFIGHNTGRGITTGTGNTIIGAGVTGLSATLSNNIIIADGSGNRRLNIDASGFMGVGTTTPGQRLSIADDQATGYVARISNTNTANTADGLLISLAVANASRTTGNYFVGFATGDGTVAGKIQGGASAVAYTTTAADLAEYFPVDDGEDMPAAGEIVMLDAEYEKGVKRAEPGEIPFGIVTTNPGFIGNGPICKARDTNCDADYAEDNALVSLVGQVPLQVNDDNGPIKVGDSITISSTTAGVGMRAGFGHQSVGYALESFDAGNATGTIRVSVNDHTALSLDLDLNGVDSELSLSSDTFWSRITELVRGFVDGVLTIAGLKADEVQTDRLCVGSVCVTEEEFFETFGQTAGPEMPEEIPPTPTDPEEDNSDTPLPPADEPTEDTPTSLLPDATDVASDTVDEEVVPDTVPLVEEGQ